MTENTLLISNFDRKIEHGLCFVAGVRIVERYNYSHIEGCYDETVIVDGNRERLRAAVIRALDYAREHGLRVQCNNPHVRGDIESSIFDTAGLIIVDSIGRTIVDDRDRTGDRNLTENITEALQKSAETLIAELEKYNDCSEWDCSECPFRLKEPEDDPRYGQHTCGWILLKSATSKLLRK